MKAYIISVSLLIAITTIIFFIIQLLPVSTTKLVSNACKEYEPPVQKQCAADQLGYKLEKTLPNSVYGGIRVADDGVVRVGVVEGQDTSSSSKDVIPKKAASYGLDKVDIRPVDNSWKTLLDTNEATHQLHQRNVDYKTGAWPIQMGIKTDRNKVQVNIPADKSKLTAGHHVVLDAIDKQYKDRVFFETYDSMPTTQAM